MGKAMCTHADTFDVSAGTSGSGRMLLHFAAWTASSYAKAAAAAILSNEDPSESFEFRAAADKNRAETIGCLSETVEMPTMRMAPASKAVNHFAMPRMGVSMRIKEKAWPDAREARAAGRMSAQVQRASMGMNEASTAAADSVSAIHGSAGQN